MLYDDDEDDDDNDDEDDDVDDDDDDDDDDEGDGDALTLLAWGGARGAVAGMPGLGFAVNIAMTGLSISTQQNDTFRNQHLARLSHFNSCERVTNCWINATSGVEWGVAVGGNTPGPSSLEVRVCVTCQKSLANA